MKVLLLLALFSLFLFSSEQAFGQPVISISSPAAGTEVNEGETFVVNLTSSVALSAAGDVLCTVSGGSGRATDSSDFSSLTAVANFGAGSSSSSCSFNVTDDDSYENVENFTVSLSSPGSNAVSGASYGGPRDFRIDFSDIRVGFEQEFINVTEDQGSVRAYVAIMDPANPADLPASLQGFNFFTILLDSAAGTAGIADYNMVAGAILLGSSVTRGDQYVSLIDDNRGEGTEFFTLNMRMQTSLGEGQVLMSPNSSTVFIAPSDVRAGFGSASYSVDEDAGTLQACVDLTHPSQSDPFNATFSIRADTADGTASAGSDYDAVSNLTLAFSNSTRRQCVPVQIADDALTEGEENFYLNISVRPEDGYPWLTLTTAGAEAAIARSDPEISFQSAPLTVGEGDGTVAVNVSASLPAGTAVLPSDANVTFSVSGVSASSGTDFATVPSFNVTIPAGQRNGSAAFSLSVSEDNVAEGDETLRIFVSGSGFNVTSPASVLTISDNDAAPAVIGLNFSPSSVSEGGGSVSVNVSASFPEGSSVLPEDSNVSVSIMNGTAASGRDFGAVPDFTVTIPAGGSGGTRAFSLTLLDDNLVEPDRSLTAVGSAAGFSVGNATLVISDDDVAPSSMDLSISPAAYSEGDSVVAVNVSASFPQGSDLFTEPVEVTVSVSGGTASEGEDFRAVPNFTLTIPAGSINGSGNFSLELIDDNLVEGDESLSVSGSSGTFSINSAAFAIQEDDAAPTAINLAVDPASVGEGDGTVVVNVSAAFPAGSSVLVGDTNVTVSVSGAGASAGVDFAAVSDFNVTIPGGSLSGSGNFSLNVNEDNFVEGNESLSVSGSAAGFTISPSAEINITDNDDAPASIALAVDPASVGESDGTVSVVVNASFGESSVLLEDTNVTVSVSGGTAVEGTDFAAVSDFNVTIPAGSSNGSGGFSLQVLSDNMVEGDEILSVGGTVGGFSVSSASVTISDDDSAAAAITLSLDPAGISESDGSVSVNASASFPAGSSVLLSDTNVSVSIVGVTAVEGTDFTAVPAFNVTIPALALSGHRVFTLTALDDNLVEPDRNLTAVGTAGSFSVGNATLVISDDDAAPAAVNLSVSPALYAEGDSTVAVNVSASFPQGSSLFTEPVDVNVSVSGVSASAGEDFRQVSDFTLTIPAGSLSGSENFSLEIVDDNVVEGDENLSVSGSSGTFSVSSAVFTIQENDVAPTAVSLAFDPVSAGEGDGTVQVSVSAEFPQGSSVLLEDTNVTVSVSGGTASEGVDFTAVSDFNVTIPAGSSNGSGTFSLEIADDNVNENAEDLAVSGSAEGFSVAAPGRNFTITDNDDPPTVIHLSASPSRVSEGSGATSISAVASFPQGSSVLSSPVGINVSVSGALEAGAAAVSDFTITIPAGIANASAAFSLNVSDDNVVMGDRNLTLRGSADGFDVYEGNLTVAENDAAPAAISLNAAPSNVSEGSGSSSVNVSASFPGGSSVLPGPVVIAVRVLGDGAVQGTDFAAVPGFNLTIPALSENGSAAFSLTVSDDNVAEGDEALSIEGSSGGFAVSPASLDVLDNDAAPTLINLTVDPSEISENGSSAAVRVSASFPEGSSVLPGDTNVTVSVLGDGAVQGTDFVSVPDFNVTIPAGLAAGSGSFSMEPVDDFSVEGDENVSVSGLASGFSVSSASFSILENDVAPTSINLSISPAAVSEGVGTSAFNVSAFFGDGNVPLASATFVNVSFSGGSATEGEDFRAVPNFTLTIPAGSLGASVSVNVTVIDDDSREAGETVTVAGNSSLGVNPAFLTIADDDRRSGRRNADSSPSENGISVKFAAPGSPVLLNLTGGNTSVIGFELYVDDVVFDSEITLDRINMSPSDRPEGNVYDLFGINSTRRLRNSVRSSRTTFAVNKDWLVSNYCARRDVSLLAYSHDDQDWKNINITYVRETPDHYHFSFVNPAFSTFAIVVPERDAPVPAHPIALPAEPPRGPPEFEQPPEVPEDSPAEESEPPEEPSLPEAEPAPERRLPEVPEWAVAVLGAVLVVAIFFGLQRRTR